MASLRPVESSSESESDSALSSSPVAKGDKGKQVVTTIPKSTNGKRKATAIDRLNPKKVKRNLMGTSGFMI
jgi:hypothetical protein